MSVIINPGTEARQSATLANAEAVAAQILTDLGIDGVWHRRPSDDFDGWFAFTLKAMGAAVDVEIPGDDLDDVVKSKPFVSRRLYVDGSSWLYGYALGMIGDRLKEAAS